MLTISQEPQTIRYQPGDSPLETMPEVIHRKIVENLKAMDADTFDPENEVSKMSNLDNVRNLCLASKNMQTLSERYLYETINWRWVECHTGVIHWKETMRIWQFLQSLIARPERGQYVQELVLSGQSFRGERDPKAPEIQVGDTYKLELDNAEQVAREKAKLRDSIPTWLRVTARVQELDAALELYAALDRGIENAEIDALLTLVLAQLPNLVKLYMEPLFTKNMTCLGMMLRYQALCNPSGVGNISPTFHRLRFVTLKFQRPMGLRWDSLDKIKKRIQQEERAAEALSFFYLPALEHIRTNVTFHDKTNWQKAPPALKQLAHLEINRACSVDNVAEILSHAKSLQSLRWTWGHEGVSNPFWDTMTDESKLIMSTNNLSLKGTGDLDKGIINLSRIAEALVPVQNTLTELKIEAKSRPLVYPQEIDLVTQHATEGDMRLLAEFPKLKTLEAPIFLLMGWSRGDATWSLDEILPDSLQTLTINDFFTPRSKYCTWDDRAILAEMKAFLQGPISKMPSLRLIRIHLHIHEPFRKEINELQAFGARVAVRVEVWKLDCPKSWETSRHRTLSLCLPQPAWIQ